MPKSKWSSTQPSEFSAGIANRFQTVETVSRDIRTLAETYRDLTRRLAGVGLSRQ
ncbi:hypothetical protein [Chthonobacter rhizosphaerae]|uniref:hypothetical protein n=1 Tax=Chthonobacter rhizosphaerae TaxID=2735553 RepID=UPI0015EF88B7|nr:hypothetical protein [Chthonobacter rhizosphaerae]